MAGKGDTFENELLLLIFKATAIPNIADNAASAPLTNLYVSLHTGSDPGDNMSQTTQEISYTGYSRVAVARQAAAGGWTVTGNQVAPAAAITFGNMTAGTGGIATYAAIGTAASGAGKVLYYGAISPTINVITGVTPSLITSSLITED